MMTDKPMDTHSLAPVARIAGIAGLLGAAAVGVGEGLIQASPGADYGDPGYSYFALIEPARQSVGHFLSVLAAPLYLLGYWHVTRNLAPQRPRLANGLFAIAAYAFIIGAVWLGQRYFLAQTVHAIQAGEATPALLADFAAHNEPLVTVLRIAIAVISVAWVWLIATGQSRYPRWMAAFSPLALLAAIFGLYAVAPTLGSYVLPVAMNAAHVVVFGLSLAVLAPPEPWARRSARVGLVLIAGLGVWGAGASSLNHLISGEICPTLGPLPACVAVLAGYMLIAVAALVGRRASTIMFWAGWAPVAMLALLGVGLEITVGDTCPRGFGNIPQCYISLAMAVAALIVFLMFRRREGGENIKPQPDAHRATT